MVVRLERLLDHGTGGEKRDTGWEGKGWGPPLKPHGTGFAGAEREKRD